MTYVAIPIYLITYIRKVQSMKNSEQNLSVMQSASPISQNFHNKFYVVSAEMVYD